MKKHIVIDTSVYFTYAFYNKIHRLINAIIDHELVVFINDKLLEELTRNIPKALNKKDLNPIEIIDEIKRVTFYFKTIDTFKNCPDPKDNFLFDLAIQTNSEVIVTQEKALLNWQESPVVIHDLKWFKENYPVD
jgi:uncharacterized protein